MRIAITSDLHYLPHQKLAHRTFAERLAAHNPDVFLIAGDLGEPLDHFHEALEIYASVCPERGAIAGNHDVWHRAFSHTSQELWEYKLAEVAGEYGYTWLERETILVGTLGICGTVAWYDYSGLIPGLLANEEEVWTLKAMFNNDGQYIDWDWEDPAFAQRVADECIERLNMLQKADDIADILLITHVPIFPECQGKPGVMSAYAANLPLGQKVIGYDKLRVVASGHIHVERFAEIEREAQRPVQAVTVPSDHGAPAAVLVNTEDWQVDFIR